MRHTILAALAAAALLVGCGGDDTTTKAGTAATPADATMSDTIKIADFMYDPDPVTVKAGQKITITNEDDAPHTVTEEGSAASFDSDTVKGGASGLITFDKAGTFKYFCVFHPTMKGTVTVVA